MESDEFGPMQSADISAHDVQALQARIGELEEKCANAEKEFGQKRAFLMDLFKKKEDALGEAMQKLGVYEHDNQKLKTELEMVRTEMSDYNTARAIYKNEEVEVIKQKHEQEIASLHEIMEEGLRTSKAYEQDQAKLMAINQKLEGEVQELKKRLNDEREGFLSSVAKSLKRVGVGSSPSSANTSAEAENLEDSMKKLPQGSPALASTPVTDRARSRSLSPELGDLDEKVKELNHNLEAEKACRTDLEMYVSVLNTQKSVLQEDNDTLRKHLHEVCSLHEQEKKEHDNLKITWQMANDQFLESQRLMMMDMRRMESVLSAEQQRQIAELQKKDSEREAQERRVKELEQQRYEQERKKNVSIVDNKPNLSLDLSPDSAKTDSACGSHNSINSVQSDELLKFEQETMKSTGLTKSYSSSQISDGDKLADSGVHETRSLQEEGATVRASPDKVMSAPGLTEAQQRALRDPTPETELSQNLVATARKSSEVLNVSGKRMVTEKEWLWLQEELMSTRAKLGRPCDMCNNYEAQLQSVQDKEKEVQNKVKTLERQLEIEKKALTNCNKTKQELEETLASMAEDAQAQISTLTNKVSESERFMKELNQEYLQCFNSLQDELKTMTKERETVDEELKKLQEENDTLIGRHSSTAAQMQSEEINLPNNLEEMQLLLLKYREDIIAAKVAKDHMEENMRSEMMFMHSQVQSVQQESAQVEEELTNEISNLQEELAGLQSVKSELERESKVRVEFETKYKESDTHLKSTQLKSKQLISALQNQLEEQNNIRTQLEESLSRAKSKIASLQVDLDNNEAVQRDFVKLSQSLQIQLEKIRQGENEVRWQHEDDVEECTNCHQSFSVTKRKHHCRHCGKIFCADCTQKTVPSGPSMRLSKVCDVCHTILVKDATPYFSTEPPPT